MWNETWQDLKFTAHLLRKSPGFSAFAILTLGLGIAFNCASFSVLNVIVLHSPPYRDADRIVDIRQANPARGLTAQLVSVPDYLDWRRNNHAFASMAAWNFQYFNLTGTDEPERVEGLTVTAEFFTVLGVLPALGRAFAPEDEQPGQGRVAILSDGIWRRRFGGDPSIVGRSVTIEDEPYVVVGVLPRDFRLFRVLNRNLDLYVPQTLDAPRSSRTDRLLFVYARIRPEVSIGGARAEMQALSAALAHDYPEADAGWTVDLQTLHQRWTSQIRPTLLMFQAATALVLLIACANLASLLLARALGRQREMAIRLALGASRFRLFRQLLVEGATLGALGGMAGVALSFALIQLTNWLPYSAVNRVEPFRLDGRVVLFGCLLTALTGLLAGIATALQCSTRALKPDAIRGRRMGNALLFAQVALTAVLLSAAGSLVRSALLVSGMSRGLNPRNVASAQIWLPPARYRDSAQIARFWRESVERVAAIPGVQSASAVSFPPLSPLSTNVGIQVDGQAAGRRGEEPVVQYWVIARGYFETLGIPLLAGRALDDHDNDEAHGVVVVSAAMARRFWPGESALGKRIRPLFPQTTHYWLPKSQNRWLTVVGIAGDVRLDGITQTLPQMYLPYAQNPSSILHLLVRTGGDPKVVAGALSREVAALDPDEPVFDLKSLEEVLGDSTTRSDVLTRLLSGFAGIAMVLAVLGIYGITACWTSGRTREIGIRIALGARPLAVVRLVASQGLPAVLAGAGVGTAGAVWAAPVLKTLLVGVSAADFTTLCAVASALLLAATAAACIPARRAAKIDPMATLRQD